MIEAKLINIFVINNNF